MPKEEEKEKKGDEAEIKIDPIKELAEAFKELGIDHNKPDFKIEDAVAKMDDLLKNKPMDYFEQKKWKYRVDLIRKHKFWYAQQINNPLSKVKTEGIMKHKDMETFKKAEPLTLPEGLYWDTIDPANEDHMNEFEVFMNEQYIESTTGNFRLWQSKEFLIWDYTKPGYTTEYFTVIRSKETKKLMASIMFLEQEMHLYGQEHRVAQVNWHVVHKEIRGKRIATITIPNALRISHAHGIQIGLFHTADNIPTPFITL